MARFRLIGKRKIVLIVAIGLAAGGVARGQKNTRSNQNNFGQTLTKVMEMLDAVRSLGAWEDQVDWLNDSLENTFQRNGWNSDTDQFAKQVAKKLTQIPPWQISQRLNVLTTELGQRWGLDPDQQTWLKERLFRDSLVLVTRNLPSMSAVIGEIIETRKAGKPFTPEQIARWSSKNSKMRDDLYQAVNTLTSEVGQRVPEEKKDVFLRDFQQINHRIEQIKQMHLAWQAGEWTPQDWGLEGDPIHAEQIFRTQAMASVGKAPELPKLPTTVMPLSAWGLYVKNFVRLYSLDTSQRTTAWSILGELEERARPLEQSKEESPPAIPTSDTGSGATKENRSNPGSPTSQPVDQTAEQQIAALFEELKVRLNALLTSTQRAQASADGLLGDGAVVPLGSSP